MQALINKDFPHPSGPTTIKCFFVLIHAFKISLFFNNYAVSTIGVYSRVVNCYLEIFFEKLLYIL